ncbi:MAG: pilin [Patescibacteria group bacterium]
MNFLSTEKALAQVVSRYQLLEQTIVGETVSSFPEYLSQIYTVFLTVVTVLAVLILVYGGIEYSISEAFSTKENAKKRMQSALFGLLLALSSALLLQTINPELLNLEIEMEALDPVGSGQSAVTDGSNPEFQSEPNPQAPIESSGDIQKDIYNAAKAYENSSTSAGPGNGVVACAWAVNNVITKAGYQSVNGDAVKSMKSVLDGSRGQEINKSEARPGDIAIVTDAPSKESGKLGNHVGICTDNGCNRVLSNSSSRAQFDYTGGFGFPEAYNEGGNEYVYRLNN